ncbi:MAG TPA: DUF6438 domain-containing protein [Candidatus Solibacter sp.]|nr:DUF6438 domain-containing protein [Candidatus Solibacter sp.]
MSPLVLIVPLLAFTASGQQATETHKSAKDECIALFSGFPKSDTPILKQSYPDDVKDITLDYFASGCYGKCPAFHLTISDGVAQFDGHAFTRAKGKKRAKLSPEEFHELIRGWFDGDFNAMRDDYCSVHCPNGMYITVTDIPDSSIKLTTPNFTKQVYQCYATVDDKPMTPKPPDQFFELSRTLRAYAKRKHWLR